MQDSALVPEMKQVEAAPFPAGESRNVGTEEQLVAALRDRDEHAFRRLVELHHRSLVRTAKLYVRSTALAEEVAQETWLGVLQGIDRFEGRSSLKSWIYSILLNRAKTRGVRESRSIPFSQLFDAGAEDAPAVDPHRFLDASHAEWPHHWAVPPRSWGGAPDEMLLTREGRRVLLDAIAKLPPAYREVLTLRDVNGLSSKEVCNILAISETNQRVLLHRARAKVRGMVETYFDRREPREAR